MRIEDIVKDEIGCEFEDCVSKSGIISSSKTRLTKKFGKIRFREGLFIISGVSAAVIGMITDGIKDY